MENQLVVLTDDHVRIEEPFFSAKKDFFNWCLEQEWNNETNVLLHCGDLFHTNLPNPKEIDLVIDFLRKSRFKGIWLMAGNGAHEFFRPKKSYAIDSLANIDRVLIMKKPVYTTTGNLKLLLLPWVPNRYYDDIEDMKQYYENLPAHLAEIRYDYVFGHFAAKKFFESEIDVDYLSGEKRMGHIHFPDEMYLGANTITRKDEQGQEYFVNLYDMETKEETKLPIPRFLDYETLSYPDAPLETEHYRIYEIINAPSKAIAREQYKGLYIHKIQLIDDMSSDDKNSSSDKTSLTILEHMNRFIKTQKITAKLADKLRSAVKEIE